MRTRAPAERGRRSAPRRSDCACAASPTTPSDPRANGSSTSRTSVRARCRISRAKRSSEDATIASADSSSACRSRCRIWVEVGAGSSPSASHAIRSTSGVVVAYVADRARQLADAHSRERAVEPRSIAIELEHPAEKLEPERRRLGVHAVRASDGHGRTLLFGARENRGSRTIDAIANQRAAGLDRQRERGVEHIGRRESEVEPASVGPEVGRDGVDERGDVVIRRPLELGDARRARNARSLSDAARARRRNDAHLGPGIENRELDGKPVLELRLVGPDRGHRRSGVASDHWRDSSRRSRGRSFHSFGTVPFTTGALAATTLESGWRQGVAPG